jgi:hypothetical protein
MGESRDAVKAATEIGVIMMGRPVQNNYRHSVIAVHWLGLWLPPSPQARPSPFMLLQAVRGEPNRALAGL